MTEGKGLSFYFEIDKYWHPFIFSQVCVSLIGQRIIWHKTDYRLPAKHFLENYNVECNNRLMVRLVKINLLLDGRFYTISVKTNLLLDIGYYTSHPKKTKAITYINLYRLKDVIPCLLLITCQIKFFAWSRCNIHFKRGIVKCTYQNGNSHHQRDQRYPSKLKKSKVYKR